MKKYITYAMTALLATAAVSIAAPDKHAMMAKEKAAWQTYTDKKSDEFRKLLHAGFMAVYGEGVFNLQKEMDSVKTSDLKSFSLSDFNVVFPDADTATTTYKVTMKATFQGKDVSGAYNSGSVWRKQNGEWLVVFHTNVKEEKPAKK